MAENSYANIKGILIEKIEAIVDESVPTPLTVFAGVYGSNVTNPAGYPICYVMQKDGSGRLLDTHRNERVWEFAVVVHYAIGDEQEEDADVAILDAIDRIIKMIDRDPTLKDENGVGQCMKVEVAPVHIERATQDVAVVRGLLNVKVYDLVQRYA